MKLTELFVVIVVYKLDFTTSSSYLSLEKCAAKLDEKLDVLIYDNSPIGFQGELDSKVLSLIYKHDPSNSGVSKAYNVGASLANVMNKKYLMLLDQDSVFCSDYLSGVAKTISKNPKDDIFSPFVWHKNEDALISPSYYKNFRGKLMKMDMHQRYLAIEGVSMINSGMIISLKLFDTVCGFDERIHLDFSDHEFFGRASKHVKHIVMVPVYLYHSLSSFEVVSIKSDLYRYRMYLNGGSVYSKSINKYIVFLIVSLGRCFLLVMKTRSLMFLKILINKVFLK